MRHQITITNNKVKNNLGGLSGLKKYQLAQTLTQLNETHKIKLIP